MSNYLGIDCQIIPRDLIPFPYESLITGDFIVGSKRGEMLMYDEENRGYILVTDKPNRYLSTRYQNWEKFTHS